MNGRAPSSTTWRAGRSPTGASFPTPGSYSSYAINGQVFREGYWALNTLRYPASFTDGVSQTIFFTDKLAHCNQDPYCNNYWPDWGPIELSPDEDGINSLASLVSQGGITIDDVDCVATSFPSFFPLLEQVVGR